MKGRFRFLLFVPRLFKNMKLVGDGAGRRYLFILGGEARSIQLIEGHHDGHHVFAVHDGDGEDILGLILGQLINKATEIRVLGGETRKEN